MSGRLILQLPRDGAFNMAADQVLAETCARDNRTILRLFRWQPWTLSLGKHQSLDGINLDECREREIMVVRRLTGGRAVLHAQELTYSICVPCDSTPTGDHHQIALKVGKSLCRGLQSLGADVEWVRDGRHRTGHKQPLCFASVTRGEILWHGKKVVGSAQRILNPSPLQSRGEHKVGVLNSSALKGRNVSAQGSALGKESLQYFPPCFARGNKRGGSLFPSYYCRGEQKGGNSKTSVILQHGSILLDDGHEQIVELWDDSKAMTIDSLKSHTATLKEILGTVPEATVLLPAIIDGFRYYFGAMAEEEFSDEELFTIEKHADDFFLGGWNLGTMGLHARSGGCFA